jgi:hypothetical protein
MPVFIFSYRVKGCCAGDNLPDPFFRLSLAPGCYRPWILLLDYRKYRYIAVILLGLGMTVRELPNSFIKRQLDIPPGMRKELKCSPESHYR